jgi:spore maturation protein CgeB
LTEAIAGEGQNVTYLDMKKFDHKPLYRIRSVVYKSLNKIESSDSYYDFPRLNESKFERYIETEKPTAILVIGFFYKYLSPSFLRELKERYKIKLFLYDTDSCNLYAKRREFIYFLDSELPVYDEIFSFSKVTTRFFKETKRLNASFLPFGANKSIFPIENKWLHDVIFVGSCDLRRIFLLENIKDKVNIYGDRWSRNYPLISDELKTKIIDKGVWGAELLNLLGSSKIVLNITRSHFYGAETGINLRIFEALANGCFLLTDYSDEVAEIFKIGEEIEVFRTTAELVYKVNYYLENPIARQEIAKKGHEKYLAEHTWKARANQLVNKLLKYES